MRRVTNIIIFSLMLFVYASAQDKLAQTGFQFLSVAQDARATGMGNAFTTVEGTANALFYNPAGLARIDGLFSVNANSFNWIADIRYISASLAFKPAQGIYGTFGFSVQLVDYGEFQGAIPWANEQGFIETEIFEPSAMAIGIGYSRVLSDRFVIGGQVRYVSQALGRSAILGEGTKRNVADVLSFDFGTIYRTGFRSLAFGMSIRNFSQETKFEEVGFQLPLTFKIGFSIEPLELFDMEQEQHHLLLLFDAVHPRSYPEYINFGMEYSFIRTFFVRGGYVSNQEEYGFSAGFGVQKFGVSIDYAYTPFGVFSSVHRFSLGFNY